MLHTADERWKDFPGYRSVSSKDWEPDMDSHVILAACQSDEVVMEVKGREGFGGAFTKELVRVLGSTDCKEETTYDDLIRLLNQLPYQMPLADGTRRSKPIFNRASSRFWAVLIGIDAYKRNPLRGRVSDALLIKSYLTNDLGVPENRIQCLLGSTYPDPDDPKSMPSRANILDTLYGLANNPEIKRGDSIIVYFSGAGCYYRCSEHLYTVKCPSGFCPTEVLWPIDRNTRDADGNWIPDISDRELNSLFAWICRAKGHKITFIVDSGYSGAMNRGQQPRICSTTFKLTSNAFLESILHAADERWKHFLGYQSVLSKDWRPDTDSHVILAACRSLEMYGRNGYSRIFTEILLRVLRSTGWKKEMTYDDLVNLMSQSLSARFSLVPFPRVSGKRMKERLWY
ncbi:uncharacterized protein EV420DRAFT_1692045 [Desarmillaria tabescens]|uniref:Peptidase C14 caspase domain-containing protein n=1 Tax=Armillaria tabescens TaxID=1929756 RepID=A0AA39K744_ARMTA|nr:uncharacterized protein EV420DRAFT_1692045 [Desarmillaria tabescens]KAK0455592.1 hypothetical protein EV420DRAFT_1692045 [Desarmillaria tabescens]